MSQSWWKEAVIYQIYPSTFMDGNGDGWGDLQGIKSKVDYLKSLGVDIVWISPIYKSPQADMGYDIADYEQIDARYGTVADVDKLILELKERDMKFMMDLVVNHTSDEHAWFRESRSAIDSPKRSWYIWKKPRRSKQGDPLPPNNWARMLGDAYSAWTYDSATDEYYLSLFTPEQPDLNWENPEVRAAVHNIMRFWLDRGVCGFRMDVINFISKDPRYPDADIVSGTEREYFLGTKYFANGPRMHEYLQEIKQKVLKPYDAITVGEMPCISDVNEIIRTVGSGDGELNMIFIFDIVELDTPSGFPRMNLRSFTTKEVAAVIAKWQVAMAEKDGWNSVFIENHDQPRSVSRYVSDSDQGNQRQLGAKLLALMQTTLSGTIFVYQGEELGMRNVPSSWDVDEYKDIESINYWKACLDLHGKDPERLAQDKKVLIQKARDHARTPMQWSSAPNGGFCAPEVKPWMRVNDDFPTCNADDQMAAALDDDLSVFQFWQRGLANRKEHPDVFVHGDFELLDDGEQDVFAYLKIGKGNDRWLVALNFSNKASQWAIPGHVKLKGWMAGNYLKGKPDKPHSGEIKMRPWEGLLAQCEK